MSGSISNNFGDIQTAYAGYILNIPGGLIMNSTKINSSDNYKKWRIKVEYRNPLNNLFFNVGYRLSDVKKPRSSVC
jgi:hypothetical protein